MTGSVCLLVALLIAGISAQESDVIDLDETNFQDSIADMDIILVEFYAPWYACSPACTCMHVAPLFV